LEGIETPGNLAPFKKTPQYHLVLREKRRLVRGQRLCGAAAVN